MSAAVAVGRRGYLVIGVSTLLTGLLLQMPAPLLYHWLKPKEPAAAVELLGVHGTLLRGGASTVTVNGRPAFSELDWKLQPLWLLLASASAQLHAQAEQTLVETDLSVWPGSRVSASALHFSGSIKSLLAAAGQPYLPLDGMVRIADAAVSLKKGWPHSAEGVVQVQQLAWTLAASPIALGDFDAQLSNTDAGISAKITATSGPLELNGEALLKPDQSYQLDLAYRPKPEATPVLRNLLASNGAPDASGWYHIKQQKQAPAPPAP